LTVDSKTFTRFHMMPSFGERRVQDIFISRESQSFSKYLQDFEIFGLAEVLLT